MQSVSSELEVIDGRLTSLEYRRDKALRRLEDCQDRRFAKQPRQASDRVIEGKTVVQLEDRSAKRTA